MLIFFTSPSSVTSRFTICPDTCDSRRCVGLKKKIHFSILIQIFNKSNHWLLEIIKLLSFQYSMLHLHHINWSIILLPASLHFNRNSENPSVFCCGCFFANSFWGQQARKLQATLVRNYHRLTNSLTGVKCGATSVAKEN